MFTTLALPASLLLFAIETLWVAGFYPGDFLHGALQWIEFVLQGLALSVPFAALMTFLYCAGHRCASAMNRSRFFSTVAVARAGAAFLLSVGLATVSNGGGSILRIVPAWHYVVAVLPAAVYLFVAHRLRFRIQPVAFAVMTYVAFALSAWMMLRIVGLYLDGGLGLVSSEGRLRSVVVLTSTVSLVSFALLASWRGLQGLQGVRRRLYQGLLLAILAGLQYVNGTIHVDVYLVLHRLMLIVSVVVAWLFVLTLSGRTGAAFDSLRQVPGRSRERAVPTAVIAAILSASGLLEFGPRTTVHYVASVHTVTYRFTLGALYGVLPQTTGLFTRISAYARVSYQESLGGEPFPSIPGGRLPATFQPLEKTDAIARPELHGAVLVFLDMKRPRDIGLYGEAPSVTPRLDACFRDAFLFENVHSAATATYLSLSAIYTSTYSSTRKWGSTDFVHSPFWFDYQQGNNLGETFRRAGFRSTAVLNAGYESMFTATDTNFARFWRTQAAYSGFNVVREVSGIPDSVGALHTAYDSAPNAIPATGKFLTVFHVMPHDAKFLPEIDEFVGRVCADVRDKGRAGDTVVILTADHGVQFREHGRTTYGKTLFTSEVRVPLLVKIPGRPGRRVLEPVSSLDHLPSLIDLFDLPASYSVEGRSYVPALFDEELPANRPVFAEIPGGSRPGSRSVVRGSLKLIRWQGTQALALFDMAADPEERVNLVDDDAYADDLEVMLGDLEEFDLHR